MLLSETFQLFWEVKKQLLRRQCSSTLIFSPTTLDILVLLQCLQTGFFLLFILLSFGSFRQEGEISINSSSHDNEVPSQFLMRGKSKLEGLLKC